MLQSLRNRRNRKGFTLAELLIVVAIIAVLVAIAVPLFVSGLQKAQEARDNANVRSVRSAGVVYILNTEKDKDTDNVVYDTNGDLYAYYKVTATITASGDIMASTLKVTHETAKGKDEGCKATASEADEAKGGWDVIAYLSSLDIKGAEGV